MKNYITILFCFFSVSLFAQLVNNNATITLKDANIYSDDLEFQFYGSVIGTGTITSPSIIVDDILSPGFSVGTLTINNDLTLNTNSQLLFEIEGDAGEGLTGGNDLIAVQESIEIDGELVVEVPNAFVPDDNDRFTLLTYNSASGISGTFETVTLDPVFDGWSISYGQLTPGLVELVYVSDLNTAITVIPNTGIEGETTMYIKIDIKEIIGRETNQSLGDIEFRLPRNPQFDFTWQPNATNIFIFSGLDNSEWDFSSNFAYYSWKLKPGVVIEAGTFSSIGIQGTFDAGASGGTTSFTIDIVNGSGGEVKYDNNVDYESIQYQAE